MHDLILEATSSTPRVEFLTNGNLILSGRTLILNVQTFYNPLMEWLTRLSADSINFTVDIDYFNSASSKQILNMLKFIDTNDNVTNFHVYWYYESDDEDILEIGQIFEERLQKARFIYKEYVS
jgi:hypothetical protein